MKHCYMDLHTHTCRSDGLLEPGALVDLARDNGIGILAITDHDETYDLTGLRQANPDMRLIQGAEVSCVHTGADGQKTDIHMVALGIDPADPRLGEVLARNKPDRRPYVEAILARLAECGVILGSYEELAAAHPDTQHLGRIQIAKWMKARGHVESIQDAFDTYLGAFGQRLAYVPNPLQYVSMEEAAAAVLGAGGIPVLAHLYYYQLSGEKGRALVRDFKALAGDRGAMEVHYGRYTPAQRRALAELADEFGLMHSAASDYHGNDEGDTLANGFLPENCRPLLERLGIAISSRE